MQVHLEWNISLNHDFVVKPIFRDFFSINENPFETEFNLNHDLITEPFFMTFLVLRVNIYFFLGIKSIMTSYMNPLALSYPLQYAKRLVT